MTDRLVVLLYGEVVGYLDRAEQGVDPSFTYDSGYVRDGEVALSARLPLRHQPYSPEKTAPYLLGLLPENSQTRDLWARRLSTSPDDTFGILAEMGWDCPGAVQFCRPDAVDELTRRDEVYQAVTAADIAQRLRRLGSDPASWTMPDEHWSLAGQQEKFALTWRAGSWHEAHGSGATTHIIKPGIRTLHKQALVEHATMAAAAAVGIDVAATRLLQFEDEWAIVIDRFDRREADDGTILRFHQEDFCQALGRLPEHKYESRGGPQLRDMMRLLRQQSTSIDDDRLALADFLIVNLVAGAPDGHAKNISILRAAGKTWVAPLYDLATGLAYDSADIERNVALSVGGERAVSRIRHRQWERAAGTLGLPHDQLSGRVAQLAEDYPDAFAAALEAIRDAPGVEEVAERAIPPLKHHCARVLNQL